MSSPARDEESITRLTINEISRLPGVYAMRNEANALIKFKRSLHRRFEKVPGADDIINEEFNRVPDSIKYGLGIGSADIIVIRRGMFIGLEMKTATGVQGPEQAKWQGWIERAGGRYILARSPQESVDAVGREVGR